MDEERKIILTMVEEGKITSGEAIKLLEALEEDFVNDELSNYKEKKVKDIEVDFKDNLRVNIGENISDMVHSIVDKSLSFGNWGPGQTTDITLEKDISHIKNPQLYLKATNGSIKVIPWDRNNICLNIIYKHKSNTNLKDNSFYNFIEDGNKIIFEPTSLKKFKISSIKLKAFIPKKIYDEIHLKTSNASINTKDIYTNKLNCNSSNGEIVLENLNSQYIDTTTSNGSFILNNINCKNLIATTKNGIVTLDNIKGENIKVNTTNGKITIKNLLAENINVLDMNTTNGSITTSFSSHPKNMFLDLKTSVGSISIDIPDLVYKNHMQNKFNSKQIFAHTIDFNENKKHLKVLARTFNGPIKIK